MPDQQIVTAIITTADIGNDVMSTRYLKVMYNSYERNLMAHNASLTRAGFRVCSIKIAPATEADIIEVNDRQGNQLYVDGKLVHVEDEHD